ncbi:glycoside hydrolase family 16 protein [Fulvivirga sp. RKSG066]|nr:glycoside hydrolase family 16 protein [Fulvivirga aurantia]
MNFTNGINVSLATKEVVITITDTDTQSPEPPEFTDKGYSTPLSYPDYTLAWNDEFEGTSLSSDWTHEIGTGSNGWGNNELQYYREENTTVTDGYLFIEAKKESFGGRQYTSSRIITENKQEFKYGRIDIRALLPKGQGLWPALWMLGANFRTVGWPKCGEIDIMEMIGGQGRENNVFGTLHWEENGSRACTCGQGSGYTLSSGTFSDEFHVFTIIWDANQIQWFVDDELFKTIDITPADLSEFQEEFFFIFNVAVGGDLPGNPDASTQFPQRMIVDYVRVFQK